MASQWCHEEIIPPCFSTTRNCGVRFFGFSKSIHLIDFSNLAGTGNQVISRKKKEIFMTILSHFSYPEKFSFGIFKIRRRRFERLQKFSPLDVWYFSLLCVNFFGIWRREHERILVLRNVVSIIHAKKNEPTTTAAAVVVKCVNTLSCCFPQFSKLIYCSQEFEVVQIKSGMTTDQQ